MSLSDDPVYFPSSEFSRLAEVEASHWWFLSRNTLITWALRRKARPFDKFLEVGCGTGFVLHGIHNAFPTAELSGSEFYAEGLAFARRRIPSASFFQLDATRMEAAEAYDAVGSFDVLEHIPDDALALANMSRALKPGGTLLVTVPQHRWLWSQSDESACHVRRYSRRELISKVREAGLEPHFCTSFVTLLLPLMWLSRRKRRAPADDMAEFLIPAWQNKALQVTMMLEIGLLKLGMRLPFGGSLLLMASRPSN